MVEIHIPKWRVWNACALAWSVVLVMEIFDVATRLPPTRTEWGYIIAIFTIVFMSLRLSEYSKAELAELLDKKERA